MTTSGVIHGHGSNGEYFSAMAWKHMRIDDAMLHCHFVSCIHEPDQLVLVHVPCRDAAAAAQLQHAIQTHLGQHFESPSTEYLNIIQYQRPGDNLLHLSQAEFVGKMASMTVGADTAHP
jgi:hypothetical protein